MSSRIDFGQRDEGNLKFECYVILLEDIENEFRGVRTPALAVDDIGKTGTFFLVRTILDDKQLGQIYNLDDEEEEAKARLQPTYVIKLLRNCDTQTLQWYYLCKSTSNESKTRYSLQPLTQDTIQKPFLRSKRWDDNIILYIQEKQGLRGLSVEIMPQVEAHYDSLKLLGDALQNLCEELYRVDIKQKKVNQLLENAKISFPSAKEVAEKVLAIIQEDMKAFQSLDKIARDILENQTQLFYDNLSVNEPSVNYAADTRAFLRETFFNWWPRSLNESGFTGDEEVLKVIAQFHLHTLEFRQENELKCVYSNTNKRIASVYSPESDNSGPIMEQEDEKAHQVPIQDDVHDDSKAKMGDLLNSNDDDDDSDEEGATPDDDF